MEIRNALFGLAVGDALGVPYEFQSRQSISRNPCSGMVGSGTHNQPPGTWSDDSSLSFCLTEALVQGYDLDRVATNFVRWLDEGFWTARGEVFDIGNTTRRAIGRLKAGTPPVNAGDDEEYSNGNGALMRILPLLFHIADKPIHERFRITHEVASITHRHYRSSFACFIYLELARNLLQGYDKVRAYDELIRTLPEFIRVNEAIRNEIHHYSRIFKGDLAQLDVDQISSSGYVVHTLEASIWCLLKNDSYAEVVLSAVDLGDDTDTTAAVAGGLAGLIYGADSIPGQWMHALARKNDIEDLAKRYSANHDK